MPEDLLYIAGSESALCRKQISQLPLMTPSFEAGHCNPLPELLNQSHMIRGAIQSVHTRPFFCLKQICSMKVPPSSFMIIEFARSSEGRDQPQALLPSPLPPG